MSEIWTSALRIIVGFFWLYFASTKWQSVEWTRGLVQSAAADNPVPGLKEFLANVVAPNWFLFSVAQTVAETVVAILLILGLATRWASIGGLLLAANLALVVDGKIVEISAKAGMKTLEMTTPVPAAGTTPP